jgi:hypothetical protein
VIRTESEIKCAEILDLRRAMRTAVEVALIITTFSATLYGCFWVMNRLGLPPLFIVAVMSATTLLVTVASIEAYYTGWIRYHLGTTDEATSRLQSFTRRFRISVFGGLIGLPAVLALIGLLLTGNWTVSAVLVTIAVLVAPWAVRKIRRELAPGRGSNQAQS